MSVNETPSKARFSLGVKILVAAVIIGFGVLHIVGDAVLGNSSAAAKNDAVETNKYGD
jgi:hypothetical protein